MSLDTSRQSHDLYLICSFSFLSPIHVRVQDPKQREVSPPGPQSPCPFPFSLSLVPHHSYPPPPPHPLPLPQLVLRRALEAQKVLSSQKGPTFGRMTRNAQQQRMQRLQRLYTANGAEATAADQSSRTCPTTRGTSRNNRSADPGAQQQPVTPRWLSSSAGKQEAAEVPPDSEKIQRPRTVKKKAKYVVH